MINGWIVFLLMPAISAQYFGNYGNYGRYGCPVHMSRIAVGRPPPTGWGPTMNINPYNAANAYAMRGMVVDPAMSGMCVDTNMQCPVWASTGQCATNPMIMRRMCALSCGTCALGMEYGMGMGAPGLGYGLGTGMGPGYGLGTGLGTGLGAAGLGYGGIGMNPLLGRSIYEQGILRSPPRSTIYPRDMKKNKLIPSEAFLPKKN